MSDWSSKLLRLFEEVRAGVLSIEDFCGNFENIYNFEVDRKSLSGVEVALLNDLFECVIWYSPFPDERREIPNYRNEDDVMAAIDVAAQGLMTCKKK